MSDNTIDLVLCSNGLIYQAPSYSGLQKGDEVIVESNSGMNDVNTTVDSTYTISLDCEKDLMVFVMRTSRQMTPLKKVLKKLKAIEFEYTEDETDAD